MKKRVCENCRFFQEAGFAKNGWCNNPQRRESSDVKLVVRRNELACRNGWAQDLWSARTGDQEAADIVLHDTISVRPVPPASVEELSFLMNSQRDKTPAAELPPANPPVDVVVGETPSTKPSADRPSLLVQDPRSAILKARERYRARMAAEVRQSDSGRLLVDRIVETVSSAEVKAPVSPPREPHGSQVPPVQISEVPRTFPTITSFPEDEIRFSSVPDPVAGFTLPRPGSPTRVDRTTTSTAGANEPEPSVVDELLNATTSTEPSDEHSLGEQEILVEDGRGRRREDDGQPDVMLPADEDGAIRVESAAIVERRERRRFELGGWRRSEKVVPVVATIDSPDLESDLWIDDPVVPSVIGEIVADVNPVIEIAPDVPRMCRTCRDFRPADSGGRGWCTNKWAFSHRRMVDADELPCETSVGCWWLPHDDVWLATADVSAHSQPTPLVDHWLAHEVGLATADTGTQRRRQRS